MLPVLALGRCRQTLRADDAKLQGRAAPTLMLFEDDGVVVRRMLLVVCSRVRESLNGRYRR